MRSPGKVIYVFNKSLTEPIPRLHGLDQIRAMSGRRRFVVLSLEPRRHGRTPEERRLYDETLAWLTAAGVEHVSLPLLGNRWLEIPMGAVAILFQVLFRGVRTIHCRSYIPALMGLLVRTVTTTRLLFDMRGLFVDEYLLHGAFVEGTPKLAFARWLEQRLLFSSDSIVVVSESFREHLLARPDLTGRLRPERIRVIPNRVDLDRFALGADGRRRARDDRGWSESTVGVFVGSTASWHRLDRTMGIMAAVMSELDDVRFVAAVYPTTEHAERIAVETGVPPKRVEFVTAGVAEMPALLAAADFGVMLIERHVSKEVCAPIKFSEYMAAGLPTVASSTIGDVTAWIEERKLGVIIEHDDVENAASVVAEFLASDEFRSGAARARCLEFAAGEMDMSKTLEDYETAYEDLDKR
jgi:glycosyltransferase involved in cell wall biosynthesis